MSSAPVYSTRRWRYVEGSGEVIATGKISVYLLRAGSLFAGTFASAVAIHFKTKLKAAHLYCPPRVEQITKCGCFHIFRERAESDQWLQRGR